MQIYATASVRRILCQENRIFRVLDRANPPAIWHDIKVDSWYTLGQAGPAGSEAPFCWRAVTLSGAFPDYVSDNLRPQLNPEEAVIGLELASAGKRIFFAPSLSGESDRWKEFAWSSDLCLVDGTFWTNDELIAAGASSKTAREIGHLPLSGARGLFEEFGDTGRGQRVLIHINNTNPVLDEDSAEHKEALRRGWQIAYDGMEFHL